MYSSVSKTYLWHVRKQIAFSLALTFMIIGLYPAVTNAKSLTPRLHDKVIVKGDLVTLADLFENAGTSAHTPLFRSPNPGTTGKISVKRILSAATKHGVRIHTLPGFSMVTISRTSRVIERSELEDLVRGQLENDPQAMDVNSQLVIKLPSELKNIHLDSALQGELRLSNFKWSARTERFTARFALPGIDPITVKGTASLMIEVSVAKSTIAKGQLLARDDIEPKLIKSSALQFKRPTDVEDMIGLSAKRSIRSGKPIRNADFETPTLIKKNQLVTILLDVPGLIIRSEGKALADAKKGEAIKVLNIQSKRIIHATAQASGLVSVSLTQSVRSGS